MYWQIHVKVTLCVLFYALMDRKLEDKTKLENSKLYVCIYLIYIYIYYKHKNFIILNAKRTER